MLRFTEQEAWHKTPYQIITLFRYHKEYNPQQFGESRGGNNAEPVADIDRALGGF